MHFWAILFFTPNCHFQLTRFDKEINTLYLKTLFDTLFSSIHTKETLRPPPSTRDFKNACFLYFYFQKKEEIRSSPSYTFVNWFP